MNKKKGLLTPETRFSLHSGSFTPHYCSKQFTALPVRYQTWLATFVKGVESVQPLSVKTPKVSDSSKEKVAVT